MFALFREKTFLQPNLYVGSY